MNKLVIDKDTANKLALARETYGNKNQITVCMEELCELACVLAKYPRYEDEIKATQELYDKVLDEVADVFIILNHVKSIFDITDNVLDDRIDLKLIRLSRWLNHSKSMQETIEDRAVEAPHPYSKLCSGCKHQNIASDVEYDNYCRPCFQAQATEGTTPFYEE